jgi:magnesium chelatase subunit I
MKQIIAELTHLARKSSEISQRSGVSVRVTICNYESLLASALKRAIRLGESEAVPRVSDLGALLATTSGKIEMESLGDATEDKVLGKLVQRAVLNVFGKAFSAPELEPVVAAFKDGVAIQTSDAMAAADYGKQLGHFPPLRAVAAKLGAIEPAAVAAAVEFVLEGLHLNRRLNKERRAGAIRYAR